MEITKQMGPLPRMMIERMMPSLYLYRIACKAFEDAPDPDFAEKQYGFHWRFCVGGTECKYLAQRLHCTTGPARIDKWSTPERSEYFIAGESMGWVYSEEITGSPLDVVLRYPRFPPRTFKEILEENRELIWKFVVDGDCWPFLGRRKRKRKE